MLSSGIRGRIGSHNKDVYLAIGLFVVAMVPRVLQLDVFLTIDEPVWIEGTVRFFQALLSRDYANAYHIDSPGITTMWAAGLGLIAEYLTQSWASPGGGTASFGAFLQSIPFHPMKNANLLSAARLPVALITSCTVVGVYLLVKELFGRKVAALSGILIALDPFYIAHSRLILLDALVTSDQVSFPFPGTVHAVLGVGNLSAPDRWVHEEVSQASTSRVFDPWDLGPYSIVNLLSALASHVG
jgi:dolichyl-phosphate-mannose--protein O-mannosyl transferase